LKAEQIPLDPHNIDYLPFREALTLAIIRGASVRIEQFQRKETELMD